MIRNAIRTAWVLLAALGMSIPLTAVSLPANAAAEVATGNFTIKQLNDDFYVGAPSFALGVHLTATANGGRLVTAVKQPNNFENHETFRLVFRANTDWCLGAFSSDDVDVARCDTGTGVVWALVHPDGAPGQDEWINRADSQAMHVDRYLSGRNQIGSVFFLTNQGVDGAFQKFLEVTP